MTYRLIFHKRFGWQDYSPSMTFTCERKATAVADTFMAGGNYRSWSLQIVSWVDL